MAIPHSTAPSETVVKEFTPIGKYRVRLVSPITSGPRPVYLDIREYINGENFQGFTRKGIRLDAPSMELLSLVLKQIRDAAEQTESQEDQPSRVALMVGKKPGEAPSFRKAPAIPARKPKAAAPAAMPPTSFSLFDLVEATEQAQRPAPEIDDSQEADIPPQYRHAPTDKEEADEARKRTPAPGKRMTLSQLAALL